MKNKKTSMLVIISLVTSLFLVNNIFALEMTPGRTTIDFEPGISKEIKIKLLNNKNKDVNLLLNKGGDLKKYISLEKNSLELDPKSSKEFIYSIGLPKELPPGLNKGKIEIIEIPDTENNDKVNLGATLALESQLYVRVPYPKKHIELNDPEFKSSDGGTTSYFPVTNRGEETLKNVVAIVNIYNPKKEKIGSFVTENITLLSGERKELIAKWNSSGVSSGKYEARVKIVYGKEKNQTINFNKTFTIGEKNLSIKKIEIEGFKLGEIAKINILVKSNWNLDVKDTYIKVEINKEKEKISEFKSPSEDIPANSTKMLKAYWDSAGIKKGRYNASLFLHYGNKTKKENMKIRVKEDGLRFIGTGNVVSETKENNKSLFSIVAVFILMVVSMRFFYLRRKFKKKAMTRYKKYGY